MVADCITMYDNFIDTSKTKNIKKSSIVKDFFKLRKLIKNEKFKKLEKEYIISNTNINDGKRTIKGTRVEPKDITNALINGIKIDKIKENFPSITSDKQIVAALTYEIRKITFFRILLVSLFETNSWWTHSYIS